jgi:hypothetical protein
MPCKFPHVAERSLIAFKQTRRAARSERTRPTRLFPSAGGGGVRLAAEGIALLSALWKAGHADVGQRRFRVAGDRRAGRGPAVARKNFYGSGSLWSGRLAATMFSLFATLAHWKLNPRLWLAWYLESCAAAGGRAPEDIRPFLPWNLSAARCAALAQRTTPLPIADTS